MNILHFSDSHLGYSEYNKIDPVTGINRREQDFYNAWQQVIEAILSLKPDVVVHAGDLFHNPRPGNRAIRVALEGIKKISDAHIPIVIVSGNHETPKIRATGSIFESIALFDNVYLAYSGKYERFTIKGIDFHCVPHCSITEDLDLALKSIRMEKSPAKNILVTHGAWSGKQTFGMGEFNEQRLPDIEAELGQQFDYIALGHYHNFIRIKDHVCYSGSTERTSLNEAGNSCGFVTVGLENFNVDFHSISTRLMVKIGPVDCAGLAAEQISARISDLSAGVPDGAIVLLTLENMEDHTFLKLAGYDLDQFFPRVFHLEKRIHRQTQDALEYGRGSSIESITVEFERYMESVKGLEFDPEKLKKLGIAYLNMEEGT